MHVIACSIAGPLHIATNVTACMACVAVLTLRLRWCELTVCVTDFGVIRGLQVCKFLAFVSRDLHRSWDSFRQTTRLTSACVSQMPDLRSAPRYHFICTFGQVFCCGARHTKACIQVLRWNSRSNIALRRHGISVSSWQPYRIGVVCHANADPVHGTWQSDTFIGFSLE